MKTKWLAQFRRAFVVALFLLPALAAYAFQPDEKTVPVAGAGPSEAKAAAAGKMSADQASVVQLAEQSGIRVEWHPRLGTPLSVRGLNLGQRQAYSGGKGLALKGSGNYESDAIVVMDNLARFYRLQDAVQEFAAKPADTDSLGYHHVRLTQRYQGLRVFGGDVIVHFGKDGQAYEVNGQYVPDIQVGVVPGIEASAAVQKAQQDLAALAKPAGTLSEGPELVIFARDAEPQLAYALTFAYDDPVAGQGLWRYWIDAREGRVLLRYNDIQKIAAPTTNGSEAAITGGILTGEGGTTLSVTGWYENTGYYYLYNTNHHWYVYNAATSVWPDYNTYAYRSISDWGTSDRVEMSAGRNFELVQRYYLEVHGRNSFNNAGIYAQANVHYGTSYVNAYWDGTAFTFGDGNGTTANSLAVLDICGHEFTHAVDQYTANLTYSGESGALNESFSDIMGTCIEFWAEPDGRANYPGKVAGTADWLCGEDSWLSSVALRDLRNPANPATVGAGNQQPTRYQGTYWDPAQEVHQNDGVQNFFFYLLSEGGSGNNDGIVYSVAGIGVTNAQRVAYRALTVYCTPSTDHRAARSAWMSAALDLNTNWAASVGAAWSAVGISSLFVSPSTTMSFRGPVGGPFSPSTQTFTLFNRGGGSMNWSVTATQAWASVTPTSGLIPANGSNALNVSINAAANGLTMGIYTNFLSFTNNLDTGSQVAQVKLLVGQPDNFTELFDAADNDLDFQTFTFTPDGSAAYYSACREVATSLPTDPTGGTSVTMSDDTYAQVTLSGPNTVTLYGRRTNVFFIGSNGYLTLNSGDSTLSESFANHFNLPRVSALFDDLYPSTGQVTWRQMSNRVAVTYLNVREFGYSNTNSFQIEMFDDGRIRLTYLRVDAVDGLAGLSAGTGVPAGFVESDLSSYGSCSLPLGIVLPSSATEGDGVLTGAGQVRLLAALTTNLLVTLSSGDTTEITVPANVSILAGQTNATFDLTVVNDVELDGTQTAAITALASGYSPATASIMVHDNETATLQVVLPATATEGQGTAPGTVQVSAVPAANITVSLSSSDTTEIQVPASVIIPSGQTSAVFTATVVNDNQIDGPQPATVTAHVQNWTDGSALIIVLDNENTNLTVTLPVSAREGNGVLTNGGSVSLSGTLPANLAVTLASDDTTELMVPATVTVLAGQTSALFNLTVVNDPDLDGTQIVQVTASAAGFMGGSRAMVIYDDESPPVPSNPSPAHLATNVIQTTGLSWQSGAVAGEIITNDVYFGTNPAPGAGELLGITTNTSWTLPLLVPQTTYYWKIIARKTGTTAGPVWQFTTRGVDHFVWNTISSPQAVGQPFGATITAKDAFNTTVSNFTGPAGLRVAGGSGEILRVDFESGLQGFTTNNSYGSGNGLWHLSTGRGSDLGHSPSHSLYYGKDEGPGGGGNYNVTNLANGGVVISSAISLPAGAGPLTLSFNYLMYVESGTNWDQAVVEVSTNGGGTYVPVAVKGAYGLTNYTAGLWVSNSVSLSQFAGLTVLLRFRFDTIDSAGNLTEGWFIDDIVIRSGTGTGNNSLSPTNTGSFTQGVWNGSVAVMNRATNVVLVADDGGGHLGLSTAFNVVYANQPPFFVLQPTNRTAAVGGTTIFAAAADGMPPLSYQWRFNGTNLSGATNTSLTLTNVQLTQAGNYSVLVTNAYGPILSSNAVLTVTIGPMTVSITPASATSVGNCIPFGANTSYGFTGFIYRNVPGFSLQPGDKLKFDLGLPNDLDVRRNIYIAQANTNPAAGGLSQNVRALGWTQIVSDSQIPTNPRGDYVTGNYELTYAIEASFNFTGGGLIIGFGGSPPGSYADSTCDQVLVCATSGDASGYFHRRFYSHADQDNGILDTTNSSATEIGGFIIERAATAPTIVNQPADLTVMAGSNASFSVTAAGYAPFFYQWQKDGVKLAGCTNQNLSLTGVMTDDAADYSVVVSNILGSVNSTKARLTVLPPYNSGEYTNAAAISIASFGAASPYPSTIIVSGLTGMVSRVTVTLNNMSHTYPDDLDILLVGPAGTNVMLMSDAGGASDLTGVTLIFDDEAAGLLPDSTQIYPGIYRPTDYGAGDIFPSPAPGGPYGANLAGFNGTDPNGAWRLFVYDDTVGDAGIVGGGWSLRVVVPALYIPVFLPPQLSGGQVQLRFATISGQLYFIEYKNALTDPVWLPLRILLGDGTVRTLTDTNATGPHRFYRLGTQFSSQAVRPVIQQTVRTVTQFQFSFITVPGQTYFVEYKNNLGDATWAPLQTVVGDGVFKMVVDAGVSNPQRFYRLRLP